MNYIRIFFSAALLLAVHGAHANPEPAPSPVRAGDPAAWNYPAFQRAFEASGRNGRRHKLTEKQFNKLQEEKKEYLAIIEKYLEKRLGEKADPAVLKAFAEVPREYYRYNYSSKRAFMETTYEKIVKSHGVGYGSTLSDYYVQSYMTQVVKPKPHEVALEIGTGSGFQVSILSRIVKEAYSIEIIKPLGEGVSKIFKPLGYNNIHTRVGDGYYGWPEVKGGFDIILVTCVTQYVPPALIEQLKPGGRLVVPIGQPFRRQSLFLYTKDAEGKVHTKKLMGVQFIPMTGHIQKQQANAR